MDLDFSSHFARYESFLKQIDEMFERVQGEYPEEVQCESGCTDCCYAMFDLHLIEALYLNHKFKQMGKEERNALLLEADKADRKAFQIKREIGKARKSGTSEGDLLEDVSKKRLRCPLLRDDDLCALYEFRPVTCRVYGLPLDIDGETHTCGKSGFVPGKQYPTVKMRNINEGLIQMSKDLAQDVGSKYADLHTMLMPVSMALLTEFDREYLGIRTAEEKAEIQQGSSEGVGEWVIGGGE